MHASRSIRAAAAALAATALAGVALAGVAHAGGATPRGPLLQISDWRTATADFGGDARLSARMQRIDWRAAPRRVGEVRVVFGASYDYTRFEYTAVPSRDRDLHRIQFPVALHAQRGAWAWRAEVAPGIATSSNVVKDLFKRGTSDDLYATGAVDATRAIGARTWSVGIASDRRFGRSQTYPRVALRGGGGVVRWQLGAPDAWIDARLGARTTLGAGAAPAGMQWHTVRDDFATDFDYRQRRWDFRVFWRQRLGERFSLSLHAGRAFDRRHRFEADAVVPIAGDAANAWAFGLRIGYGDTARETGYAEAW